MLECDTCGLWELRRGPVGVRGGLGEAPGLGLQRLTVLFSLCLQHELYIRAYHMLSDFPPVSVAIEQLLF